MTQETALSLLEDTLQDNYNHLGKICLSPTDEIIYLFDKDEEIIEEITFRELIKLAYNL